MIMEEKIEKIEKAAKEYSADRFFENDGNISNVREISFEAGAKWVLDNIWHDVDKELPLYDYEAMLVVNCMGAVYIATHDSKNGKWYHYFENGEELPSVIYWMPIPSLPTCSKNE